MMNWEKQKPEPDGIWIVVILYLLVGILLGLTFWYWSLK